MNQSESEHQANNASPFARDYRPDIDGLRAIAVIAVIANHFYKFLLPGGFLGVDMFFVISGYVITTSLTRLKESTYNARTFFIEFYSRRIKRILPALIVCVLLTCVVGSAVINSQNYQYFMKAGFFALFGLSNIYFFREAADYFGSSVALNLFTHTWSLGVEEQFYAVFPILLWVSGNASNVRARRYFLAALGLLIILSFLLYIWLNKTMTNGAYFLMPPRFWELGIGCMAALAPLRPQSASLQRLPLLMPTMRASPLIASILLVIALIAPVQQHIYTTPIIVVGTAVLIITLKPGTLLYKLLTWRWVLLLGLMSYSLYLWHWSVLSISRWTIGIHWWSTPIQIIAILALAASSYVFVERPLRRAEWSTSKLMTIAFGLIAVVCSASVIVVLKLELGNILYTGTPANLIAKGVTTLMDDRWYAGKLQWHPASCILSSDDDVGKQINADACTLAPLGEPTSATPHFLVIGNSFSAAEFEMYAALSEGGLGVVTATSSWGASPVSEIPNNSPWANTNKYYWSTVVPKLLSALNTGDFLIMINDLSDLTPAIRGKDSDSKLALLNIGLKRLAGELRTKGIQIIFQSQNPFIREAQCNPDLAKRQWFNMGQDTICTYYTKIATNDRLQPLLDVLNDVKSKNPNFHILDLGPVLCPGNVCKFYNDQGVFLYRDEWSHPSVEADYLARPIFLNVVNRAIEHQTD